MKSLTAEAILVTFTSTNEQIRLDAQGISPKRRKEEEEEEEEEVLLLVS